MSWQREDDFKALMAANIKHLTKDGLDGLVAIAIKDAQQCYKAVPALAVHMIKRTRAEGPGRLHVLRIIEAIVARSKAKGIDKFGALSPSPHPPPPPPCRSRTVPYPVSARCSGSHRGGAGARL